MVISGIFKPPFLVVWISVVLLTFGVDSHFHLLLFCRSFAFITTFLVNKKVNKKHSEVLNNP